jgi:hypothetical protein
MGFWLLQELYWLVLFGSLSGIERVNLEFNCRPEDHWSSPYPDQLHQPLHELYASSKFDGGGSCEVLAEPNHPINRDAKLVKTKMGLSWPRGPIQS